MSNILHGPEGYLDLRILANIAVHSGTTDSSDSELQSLDTRGFEYVVIGCMIDTTSTATITVRESSDDSTFTNVTGASMSIGSGNNHSIVFGVVRCASRKRYLDVELAVPSGSSVSGIFAIPCSPDDPAVVSGSAQFSVA